MFWLVNKKEQSEYFTLLTLIVEDIHRRLKSHFVIKRNSIMD
jgi:hypothetical protein